MDHTQSDMPAPAPGQPIKKVYSTPKVSDFGSVETLSLSGTENPKGENPGAHAKNKP
jgi:hypothetical protein